VSAHVQQRVVDEEALREINELRGEVARAMARREAALCAIGEALSMLGQGKPEAALEILERAYAERAAELEAKRKHPSDPRETFGT